MVSMKREEFNLSDEVSFESLNDEVRFKSFE